MKMKIRSYAFIFLFFLCSFVLHAGGQMYSSSVPEDAPPEFKQIVLEGRIIAQAIGKKISGFSSSGKTFRVRVMEFYCSEKESGFGDFWKQNLLHFLDNGQQSAFTLTVNDSETPDFIVCGEIVNAGGYTRIYTQLMKRDASTIIANWVADFSVRNIYDEFFYEMLSSGLNS